MGERGTRGNGGGFAPLEASSRRVVGVSWLYWCNSPCLVAPSTWAELDRAPLMVQFPLFGGDEVAVRGGEVAVRGTEVTVRGGVAPKVQTTSAKNADNGVSWARWSTFWAKLSRTWCVARTRTRYSVRSPAIPHVNPLFHVWAGLPTLTLAGPRAHERTQARIRGPTCEASGPRARCWCSLGAVSHAIRLGECSTVSTNVAIPTMRMRGATQGRGNCMRHSSIADPTGVMRCRRWSSRWRSRWRRQWSSRWRTRGMTWWAPSALANCPLTLNVHTWLRVRPRIGRVGVFMPHGEKSTLNTDFPAPAQRKAAT